MELIVMYCLSATLFIYAGVNQILIIIKNAQMKHWLDERRKEVLAHRAELDAITNGTKIPFPEGRTIKE